MKFQIFRTDMLHQWVFWLVPTQSEWQETLWSDNLCISGGFTLHTMNTGWIHCAETSKLALNQTISSEESILHWNVNQKQNKRKANPLNHSQNKKGDIDLLVQFLHCSPPLPVSLSVLNNTVPPEINSILNICPTGKKNTLCYVLQEVFQHR